ncbi:MAG: radical SAM protein, partial [Candidatus Omnitrophota bacterium]|nr:radical SAM protein [Candidatus Omnitrophota bacterium]
NFDLSYTYFRLFKKNIQTFSYLGYREQFVIDIPDLPLILTIIRNYQKKRHLLEGMDETIKEYIRSRPLGFFKLRNDIVEMYNIINKHLPEIQNHDVVLFTTYETNLFSTIMCSLLLRQRRRNCLIIYGGPQVTQSDNSRKLVLRLGIADAVIVGEGEEALLKILESYRISKQLVGSGIMSKEKNNNSFRYQPALPADIDNLPCPDFSLFNLNDYPRRSFELPLYSSRGCLFRCAFCNEWLLRNNFKQMPPGKVVEWMKELHRRFGAVGFRFNDSLVNASLPWLEEFTDIFAKEKLNFTWYGLFRAQMSPSLARRLKKCGLSRAFIGIEALSPNLLKKMNKKLTVKDNLNAIEAFCSCGIPIELGNIVGFPFESKSDFQKRWQGCLDWKKKYGKYVAFNIEPFQLRPGAPAYENLKDFGLSVKKWDSKVVGMVPEASDIVSKVYMTVKGQPEPLEVIERFNFMLQSLT